MHENIHQNQGCLHTLLHIVIALIISIICMLLEPLNLNSNVTVSLSSLPWNKVDDEIHI